MSVNLFQNPPKSLKWCIVPYMTWCPVTSLELSATNLFHAHLFSLFWPQWPPDYVSHIPSTQSLPTGCSLCLRDSASEISIWPPSSSLQELAQITLFQWGRFILSFHLQPVFLYYVTFNSFRLLYFVLIRFTAYYLSSPAGT